METRIHQKAKCIEGHPSTNFCAEPLCNSPAFVCADTRCRCHQQHSRTTCTNIRLASNTMDLLDAKIERMKQPWQRVLVYLKQRLEKEVVRKYNQVVAFLDRNPGYGLSKEERKIVKLLKTDQGARISGKDMSEMIGNLPQSQLEEIDLQIQTAISTVEEAINAALRDLNRLWVVPFNWERLKLRGYYIRGDFHMHTELPSEEKMSTIFKLQINHLPIDQGRLISSVFPNLEALTIWNGGEDVGDNWCTQMSRELGNLRKLHIYGSSITRAGVLRLLEGMSLCKHLQLHNSGVVDKEQLINELTQQRPETKVYIW